MLVQVIQDLCHGAAGSIPCEDGFDIFFVIAQKLSPEQNQQGIQKSVSIFLMSQVFDKKILQGFYNDLIISSMKDQKIPLCFLI